MTNADTTPSEGVHSTSLPVLELARLEDQLNHLLACHVFYDTAIRAITHPEFEESLDNEHWQLGLFLQQQWLHDQGKSVVSELQRIRQGLCE